MFQDREKDSPYTASEDYHSVVEFRERAFTVGKAKNDGG